MPELLEIIVAVLVWVLIAAFFIAITIALVDGAKWLYQTVYRFMWERSPRA